MCSFAIFAFGAKAPQEEEQPAPPRRLVRMCPDAAWSCVSQAEEAHARQEASGGK